MNIDKIQEGIAWLMVILILVMSATGFILGLKLSKQTQEQNELQEHFLKNQINDSEDQSYEIMFGTFIGINAYGSGKSYHVILVGTDELETVGNKNYTFIMNEKVMVLVLGDTLYSIPLREE